MAKTKDITDARRFQAYFLYKTSGFTQERIAQFFDVSRQTIVNWLTDVRKVINEPEILEMAKKNMIALIPKAVKHYDTALERNSPDSASISVARDLLRNSKVLTEAPETQIQVNISVVNEERQKKQAAGLRAFGFTLPNQN